MEITPNARYQCPDCTKSYVHEYHLRRHQRAKHQGVRHACQQCDKTFIYTHDLHLHVMKNHCGAQWKLVENMDQEDNSSNLNASPIINNEENVMELTRKPEQCPSSNFGETSEMKVRDENENVTMDRNWLNVSSQASAKLADFCEECGTAYTKVTARFCKKCGAPRELL